MFNSFSPRALMTSLLTLVAITSGCGEQSPTAPPRVLAPPPVTVPPSPPTLRVFTHDSGSSSSEVRDADEQIVQFNTTGELIWVADGTRLPGYAAQGIYILAESVCKCAFEVRWGVTDGEWRPYLTGEYGHYNPGTILNLELVSGALVVTTSNLYPPGSHTLSGTVTEESEAGRAPVEGIWVSRLVGDGWREAQTDQDGSYAIPGLYDGTSVVSVGGPDFISQSSDVSISGDTRYDIRLVRR